MAIWDPQANEIFLKALELESRALRRDFLDEACGPSTDLRAQVESLLEASDNAGSFLRSPASSAVGLTEDPAPDAPAAGTRIGRYRLLEQIGEGGFGVVFMAEQTSPVHRKVALKIVKAGMDTRQVIGRFEAERQALAMMDHPNIAKVFDAGVTETGRPYFVMELVKGVPITKYCDEHRLTPRDRLELFVQVCHAVQHAHQKGIIHRDLKPTNVLVAQYDGLPVPKVIDFGVAKAMGRELTERTMFTGFGDLVGTPQYMSPEQAEVNQLDVDTRSDIYSLGVLLYELLTGTTPLEHKRVKEAALLEVLRVIREEEPPRPSTRLTTTAELPSIAAQRGLEPKKLSGLVHGELDWIVMKALEKDRARRYETANGLAMDVQRYLRDEPVQACPPSAAYRFRKFARRHRGPVMAATLLLLALVSGIVATAWQASRATRAEALAQVRLEAEIEARQQAEFETLKAQTEGARSAHVALFLQEMLRGVQPGVALGRDTTILREILDKTAERVERDLHQQPEVAAELRTTVGDVYSAIGAYDKAEAMHRQALAARRSLLGDEHPSVADSLSQLGLVLNVRGRRAEAESLHRDALAMRRKQLGSEHLKVAASLNNLGLVLRRQGKLEEAEAAFREGLAIRQKQLGEEDPIVADSLNSIAIVLENRGALGESEALQRRALTIYKKRHGDEHPAVALSLDNLGIVLRHQGRLDEAETTHREALAMRRKLLGDGHSFVADSLGGLGNVLCDQGRLNEAEILHHEALAMRRRLLGNEHPHVAASLNRLAIVLDKQGKQDEAERLRREALTIRTMHSEAELDREVE